MLKDDNLEQLALEYRGYLTTSQLYSEGFTKFQLYQFVKSGLLERISRGRYYYKSYLPDDFYIMQSNKTNIIYSNETALYLHNLTTRFPRTLSFTTFYHKKVRNKDSKIYYVKKDILELGKQVILSPNGNEIYVYDQERTICDIIKNKNKIELQIYIEGLQEYFLRQNSKPNLNKLSRYAKILGVSKQVSEISRLYLEP